MQIRCRFNAHCSWEMNGSTLYVCKGIDIRNVFIIMYYLHYRSFHLSSHYKYEEESEILHLMCEPFIFLKG